MCKDLKIKTGISIDRTGTIGNILNNYIDEYVSNNEIKEINAKIAIMNQKLSDFDMLKYKLSNRIKIRGLVVKVLSEDSDVFVDLAIELLNISEDNFENIIDSFMKLTKNDLDVLYYNLWKKRGNEK